MFYLISFFHKSVFRVRSLIHMLLQNVTVKGMSSSLSTIVSPKPKADMGRPRNNPHTVVIVPSFELEKPSVPHETWDELCSCVGNPKHIKKIAYAIDDLAKKAGLSKIQFVRQFRAFRLYKSTIVRKQQVDTQVDWISLSELNKLYELGLPPFNGAEREYQAPQTRVWGKP